MKTKEHTCEWKQWEIRGVYDGILYKDCTKCPRRVVFHTARYELWQNAGGRTDSFKEVEYLDTK